MSLTSGSQTLTPGTPITVTHVSSASTPGVGLSLARQGAVKTATITSIDGGSTAIQVHPVQPGQRSVVGLPQSLVAAQSVQVLNVGMLLLYRGAGEGKQRCYLYQQSVTHL